VALATSGYDGQQWQTLKKALWYYGIKAWAPPAVIRSLAFSRPIGYHAGSNRLLVGGQRE